MFVRGPNGHPYNEWARWPLCVSVPAASLGTSALLRREYFAAVPGRVALDLSWEGEVGCLVPKRKTTLGGRSWPRRLHSDMESRVYLEVHIGEQEVGEREAGWRKWPVEARR